MGSKEEAFDDLLYAARSGDLEDALQSLKDNPDITKYKPESGSGATPLHYAAANGHLEIMRLLISHGADLNAVNEYGNTALHFAAINEKADAVELLLRNKADAALSNEFNRNPFDEAVAKNNGRIRHMLMKYIEENQNANVEDLEKQ
mmetsp:Transcript_30322/g.116290  ORF Transcript_30322/g.116290 Transcript_30322/m.116290 type:complete len:147 (-) Transcript_30322:402-842(-)|eukprot:CAMPEP_0113955034 /NCGR_PEP_ID=MMETSP0011_2-20120614/1023_1 /TAXON_ID=101924 /ORGANISM="Rhodosorus marinus" /LENGTH=146 /DNA_ID=CAMNT_0000964507 /DNA_START=109 /DNA_END=549 /DNA_ORIENTATION=- /assembly_acc=CAM_ASM_000156